MSQERITLFAEVLLPLPLPKLFTYRVPYEWNDEVQIGQRVAVPFGGKKMYSGILWELHDQPPKGYNAQYISELLDEAPIVTPKQMDFWNWTARYSLCSLGDVMAASMPAGFRVQSQTQLVLHAEFDPEWTLELEPREQEVLDLLKVSQPRTVMDVQEALGIRSVMRYLKSLHLRGVIAFHEDMRESYKPKFEEWAVADELWESEAAGEHLDQLEKRAYKQFEFMMLLLSAVGKEARIKDLVQDHGLNRTHAKGLEKKGLIRIESRKVDRFKAVESEAWPLELSEPQKEAYNQIERAFENQVPVLLDGVTGSGKTWVYAACIRKAREEGKQVLILMPEAALTEYQVQRLAALVQEPVGVWHHWVHAQERTELYAQILSGEVSVVLGTRTALFAPFQSLGLIVMDEEHEGSYKGFDKRPLIHAREAAFTLAQQHGSQLLLGSATPSFESLHAAREGAFTRVRLESRFDYKKRAELAVLNLALFKQQNRFDGFLSEPLQEAMAEALKNQKGILVFHPRKGYVPYVQCELCGTSVQCHHCDISLTYYKSSQQLKCGYCGYSQSIPHACAACGSTSLQMKGMGSEKMAEELELHFPEARIERFDQTSLRKRSDVQMVLNQFKQGEIDILVGTQLLARGLDLERVDLIAVPQADSLFLSPDFRSSERAYQWLHQLMGRAPEGKCYIQTFQPEHPVLEHLKTQDYEGLSNLELPQRKEFRYPPYARLVQMELQGSDPEQLFKAAAWLSENLRQQLGDRILGPQVPNVARVKNLFRQQILVKIDKQQDSPSKIKHYLNAMAEEMSKQKAFRGLRVSFDVDPH